MCELELKKKMQPSKMGIWYMGYGIQTENGLYSHLSVLQENNKKLKEELCQNTLLW